MDSFHTPVLLDETIEYLKVRKGEKYIDCTLGGGGHSARIVELGGKVLSIDQDEDAIEYAKKLHINKNNWIIQKGNFANIEEIAKEAGFDKVNGVLFDLGVSSHQFEDESRGFSFNSDAELDMRMDKSLGVKASVLVNGLARKELERLFWNLEKKKMPGKSPGRLKKFVKCYLFEHADNLQRYAKE